MKKQKLLFGFTFLLCMLFPSIGYAKQLTLTDLGNEAISLNPNTNYIYVVGNYAFTSEHQLTTQDVMLAARTISIAPEDGLTNTDSIYQKMGIYKIIPQYDATYDNIIAWKYNADLLNPSSSFTLDESINIDYIDYIKLKDHAESTGSEYSVASLDDLNQTDQEMLTKDWNFHPELNTISKTENGILQGTLKEQHLKEGTFKDSDGYFMLLKISFPTEDKTLNYYKDKWTVILNDENNMTKEVIPTPEDYQNGYMIVLFKIKEDQSELKYQIDFDGSSNSFLPKQEVIQTNFTWKTENTITFEYLDENGNQITSDPIIVYQDEVLSEVAKPEIKNPAYHEFKYWFKESASEAFDWETEKTGKDENLVLKAHWILDDDAFIEDVVADFNNPDSEISDDYSSQFELKKSKNTITIQVNNPTVTLKDLNETTLLGSIAYAFSQGKIQKITLATEGTQGLVSKEFTSNSISEVDTIKQQLVTTVTQLFKEALDSSDDVDNMTLSKMALEEKTFTITIEDTSETVTLKNPSNKTYTFTFESNNIAVSNEQELQQALSSSKITSIYIADNIDITEVHTVNRVVTMMSLNEHNIHTLTATNEIDEIFNITSPSVTIFNLKLTGAKKAILIENGAVMTANHIDVSGNSEAGFVVKLGGKLTASQVTDTDETYVKPLVKAEKKSGNQKAIVEIQNNQEEKITPTTVEEIIKYNEEEEQPNQIEFGDIKQENVNYSYQHYFLNKEIANRWVKIAYIGNRSITGSPLIFIRYYDKETKDTTTLEPPTNIKYLTTYSNSLADFKVVNWFIGDHIKYKVGEVPAPTSDISYYAELEATYKATTTKVTTEQNLKEAVKSTSEYKVVIVSGTIELTEELNIEKDGLLITGSDTGKTTIDGTIKGKVKVSSNNVILDQLKIIGSTNAPNSDRNDIVTIVGTGFRSSEVIYEAEPLNNQTTWNSALYYTHDAPTTLVYFNEFYGTNLQTFIDFKGKIADATKLIGNDFLGSTTTKNFIIINEISEGANIDIKQTTAKFVGTDEYGIKIKAPNTKTNATISLGNFWFDSKDKVLQVLVEVTSDSYDVSGYTIKAGNDIVEKLKIYYRKNDEQPQVNHPLGNQYQIKINN